MKEINRWLWAVFGIIFSFSAAMILIGGSFSSNSFYDQGDICEIVDMDLEMEGTNLLYLNRSDAFFTITEDTAVKGFHFYENEWNYLLFQISDLSVPNLPVLITYLNTDWTVTAEQKITLNNGWNIIEPAKKNFISVCMVFQGCTGEKLRIRSAMARTMLSKFSLKKFAGFTGVFLLVYCIISVIVVYYSRKCRKHKRRSGHWWIDFYLNILELIYSRLQQLPVIGMTEKDRQRLRILCILAEILCSAALINADRMKSWYYISMGSQIFFLLTLSVLMVRPVKKKIRWNTKLCYIWGLLCISMCISDFIVGKVFTCVGYVFLFVFGVFFYCWMQMENPDQLLKETGIALQISFVLIVLFCVLCRPATEGIRYAGCFINPNPFGRYLISVFVAVFTQIDYQVQKGIITWRRAVLYGLEIDLLFYLIWKSQCRGAMLGLALLILFMFIRLVKMRVSATVIHEYLRILAISSVCIFPVKYITDWLLYHIPYFLGIQVHWKKDALYALDNHLFCNPFAEQVYASASRIIETLNRRSLDSMSSGRVTYWKAYLRNMNLWGHEFRCQVNGGSHSAHNMFLDTAYRYGVVAAGIYIVFWGAFLKEVWRKLSCKNSYAFMAAGCVISYVGMALVDTLEQPWVYLAWTLAYMSAGYYLFQTDTVKENDRLYEEKIFHQ
ncbi:MAG: hypothetical protein HFJ05_07945 [Eubacterium sp.]|nr:hypothetical protein [Eubacterium sp.]